MKLSILDQSPVRQGGTFQQALHETLLLAKFADRHGYHRFWVSEHHGSSFLAGSSPEVLLSSIGAVTDRIRLGSGGVMLPHYSAFKVAENFSVLSNLYPDRVDLGVGRAPGTDMETARAIISNGQPNFERFPKQIDELLQRLGDPTMRPVITPMPVTPPPVWVLGTSPSSALLAAEKGLPYNFARFINNEMGPELFELYRDRFRPSAALRQPQAMVAIDVFVGETEQEALERSLGWQIAWAQMMRGDRNIRVLSKKQAKSFPLSLQERALLDHKIERSIIGDPATVKQKLESLASSFGIDEVMVVTITHDFEDRLSSYELLADQFALPKQRAEELKSTERAA